ncbi:yippee-like protein [Arabidopsis thaliana]|nr:yippee-like protein [Arabidopsis thaliana]
MICVSTVSIDVLALIKQLPDLCLCLCCFQSFHCKHGRAYLFDNVVNVTVGEKEHRVMITGWHTVADIFCVSCGSLVGWKYEIAYDKSQKYKEGKFILERFSSFNV